MSPIIPAVDLRGHYSSSHVECIAERCRFGLISRFRRAISATTLITGRIGAGAYCRVCSARDCNDDSKYALCGGVGHWISYTISSLVWSGPNAIVDFRCFQFGMDSHLDRFCFSDPTRSKAGFFRRVVSGDGRNLEQCCSSNNGNRSWRLLSGTDNVALYRRRRHDSLATPPTGNHGTNSRHVTDRFWRTKSVAAL